VAEALEGVLDHHHRAVHHQADGDRQAPSDIRLAEMP
jgi:hypothetical protein